MSLVGGMGHDDVWFHHDNDSTQHWTPANSWSPPATAVVNCCSVHYS